MPPKPKPRQVRLLAKAGFKEMTAPELVISWKKLVNDNVMMGRDSHLIKNFLIRATPCQILLGMYQYKDIRTVTIPQFLDQYESWLLEDDMEAEIELATYITHTKPPEYYIWQDLKNEQSSEYFVQALAAHLKLREWTEKVLA